MVSRHVLLLPAFFWLLSGSVAAKIGSSSRGTYKYHPKASFRQRTTLSQEMLQNIKDTVGGGDLPGIGSLRRQQQQQQACSLCGNYTLQAQVLPKYPPYSGIEEENLTCQDFDFFASTVEENSEECSGLKSGFLYACCDVPPRHECERTLRSDRLSNYDSAVAPSNTTTPTWPIDIEIHVDFFAITELDVQASTSEIFVWIWMSWKDSRLAWDLNEYCAFITTYRASFDTEKTEIWVPDIDLYNQAQGVQQLPEANAEVYSDGTVLWRRNGPLRAHCLFSGLRRMPFDTLGCRFMLGGWTRWGQLNLHLADGVGFAIDDFQPKYAEYRIVEEKCKAGYMDTIDGVPEDVKTGVYYDFYFERAQRFYIIGIIIPAILFTTLSFGMFLLDLRVGERLSYGMALLLVLAAQQIVTTSYLPVTNERLFAVVLVNASFYWVVFALLESVLIGYLFFVGHDEVIDDHNRHGNLSMLQHGDLPPSAVGARNGGISNDVIDEELSDDGGKDANEQSPPSCRGFSIGQSFKSFHTFKQTMFSSKRPVNFNRKLICSIDKWCFRIVPTTYVIFLIVFFATLPTWEESGEDLWEPEETEL